LHEDSVVRKFRITATDGKNYNTLHYNLSAIIAVGYKVNSERAVQFRKWATGIIKEFTIKAYVMDDERLKNDGTILGKKYFEEQLERIREIRLSERKFYQKITDIYATSIDYDVTATATKRFFATVQNKMHYAIHGQTAAEVIVGRADHEKQNMGLTTWEATLLSRRSFGAREDYIRRAAPTARPHSSIVRQDYNQAYYISQGLKDHSDTSIARQGYVCRPPQMPRSARPMDIPRLIAYGSKPMPQSLSKTISSLEKQAKKESRKKGEQA
jgi:hypothetical protein